MNNYFLGIGTEDFIIILVCWIDTLLWLKKEKESVLYRPEAKGKQPGPALRLISAPSREYVNMTF